MGQRPWRCQTVCAWILPNTSRQGPHQFQGNGGLKMAVLSKKQLPFGYEPRWCYARRRKVKHPSHVQNFMSIAVPAFFQPNSTSAHIIGITNMWSKYHLQQGNFPYAGIWHHTYGPHVPMFGRALCSPSTVTTFWVLMGGPCQWQRHRNVKYIDSYMRS